MLKINLIPSAAKEEMSRQKTNQLIWFYGIAFVGMAVASTIILYGLTQYYKIQLRSLDSIITVQEGSSAAKSADELAKKIKAENATLERIDGFLNSRVSIYDLMEKISLSRIGGVSYGSVLIEPKQEKIIINGFAARRDLLQALKSELEKIDVVESVDLPVANILQPVDIDFRIELKLKK